MEVYWSLMSMEDNVSLPEINFYKPENLYKKLLREETEVPSDDNYKLCPSVREITKQIYTLKMPFDYRLNIDRENGSVTSDLYDQEFFDRYINIRSSKEANIGFKLGYVFFCEHSLEIETTGPHFSDNIFANSVRVIPGKMNIGYWIRPLECPFIVHSNCNFLDIKRGDDCVYVKFNTDKDIKLKKFYMTDTLQKTISLNLKSKAYLTRKFANLDYWYNLFAESSQKKMILREIRNNLMD